METRLSGSTEARRTKTFFYQKNRQSRRSIRCSADEVRATETHLMVHMLAVRTCWLKVVRSWTGWREIAAPQLIKNKSPQGVRTTAHTMGNSGESPARFVQPRPAWGVRDVATRASGPGDRVRRLDRKIRRRRAQPRKARKGLPVSCDGDGAELRKVGVDWESLTPCG